jgi:hypothetical protein
MNFLMEHVEDHHNLQIGTLPGWVYEERWSITRPGDGEVQGENVVNVTPRSLVHPKVYQGVMGVHLVATPRR